MIVLDTSAVLVAMDATDPRGPALRAALERERPWFLSSATLGELGYLIQRELGVEAVIALLTDIADGLYETSFDASDAREAVVLLERFPDLDLGLVDATAAACAIRHDAALATFDLRDFGPLSRAIGLRLMPA